MSTVAKQQQLTIRQRLEGDEFQKQIAMLLPKHVTPERMVRTAITAMLKTPALADCDQASFFQAMLNLSQWGLEPDGRRAHLIPFKNKKKNITECQLIIDYKGMVELVLRTGNISKIHADVVCENDLFEYDMGEIKSHQIDFKQPRGDAYAAYCLIVSKDGSSKCEVMTKQDIYSIRDNSQGWIAFQKGYAKQSVWDPKSPHTEYEMWKKTVFKRASKWVELSNEIRGAIDHDNADYVRSDFGKGSRVRSSTIDLAPKLEEPKLESESESDPLTDWLAAIRSECEAAKSQEELNYIFDKHSPDADSEQAKAELQDLVNGFDAKFDAKFEAE